MLAVTEEDSKVTQRAAVNVVCQCTLLLSLTSWVAVSLSRTTVMFVLCTQRHASPLFLYDFFENVRSSG